MSVRGRSALAGLAGCAALALLSQGRASDHLDGPRATADPQADITDLFAFTSPDDASRLVLAMTVTPYASATSRFSSGVDYVFRVRRITTLRPLALDTEVLDVTCTFDDGTVQRVSCAAPRGRRASAPVGDTAGGDSPAAMPLFAGLRSDPAFFDRQGAAATLVARRSRFTGQNVFAGSNVLAIVLEVDAAA
ncbi:MAG: DUF4331 domain-containing protein, partial [Myxococcota bacterium]|nr:DUF4331 domain-containing protein [Myxococcota bacterium]